MLVRKLVLSLMLSLAANLVLASQPFRASAQPLTDPRMTGGEGQIQLRDATGTFTLNFISTYPGLSAETARGLTETFLRVIGEECAFYDPNCPKIVDVFVEKVAQCGQEESEGPPPACADKYWDNRSRGFIRIDGPNIKAFPKDLDIVTHEAMHVVQGYNWAALASCFYWYEGEADYARAMIGQNLNGWSLPLPGPGTSYTTGYADTASFLYYIGYNWGKPALMAIHQSLASGVCPPQNLLASQTGHATFDALYQAYVSVVANNTPPATPIVP